jgi:DNA-binding HxlR family transcriptional regulator
VTPGTGISHSSTSQDGGDLELARDSTSARATVLEPGGPSSIAVSNGIVGDEWTLWIVDMAMRGLTQYNKWLRAGPISSSVLAARLSRLAEADIMNRVAYNSRPPRHDYRLTARGRSMWPILLTMLNPKRVWEIPANAEDSETSAGMS